MRRFLYSGLVLALFATSAFAEIVMKPIEYKVGDVTMKGQLAFENSVQEKQPAILVFPEWWGVNDYAVSRAKQLAEIGYVALAVDMYGDGATTTDPKVAGEWAGKVKGTPLMRERAIAALAQLVAQPHVDATKIGAIGFCFGGTAVLELAYSGADLKGVVSFHGGLTAPQAGDTIKAAILVCHGAADTFVKPEEIKAFQEGVEKKGADWEMVYYAHAVHAFTNPDADKFGIPGIAYDEKAAKRSWEAMQQFFNELFAGGA